MASWAAIFVISPGSRPMTDRSTRRRIFRKLSSEGLEKEVHILCMVVWDMYRICAWRGVKGGSGLRDVWRRRKPHVIKANEASVLAAEEALTRSGRLDLTPSTLFFGLWIGLSTWRQDVRVLSWIDSSSCANGLTLATPREAVGPFGRFLSPVMLFLFRGPLGKREESDSDPQFGICIRVLTIISE